MENGKLKIFSDAAGRVPIRYFPNPPGSLHGRSQGVVVGSFRHSMGCYRHPTLRAAGCRPYSPSGKLVLFIIPVLSPTCVTPHQSILPVPRSRQYCQLPPGGSQGVVAAADPMQRTTLSRKLRVARLATPTLAGQNDGCIPFPYPLPQLRRYRALIPAQLFSGVIGPQVNHQGQRQQNQRNGKRHVNLALLTGVHIQCHGQCCRRSPQCFDKSIQL